MVAGVENKKRGISWVIVAVVVVIVVWFSLPVGRRLTGGFFSSLRVQKVQAVNVNLSNFVGPNADSALQTMISQMISDKVTVTQSEKPQPAANAAVASQLAGFKAQLLGDRKDKPELLVTGAHAFTLTVDRARLQAILHEAGRPDLTIPPSMNGAKIGVSIPREIRARYGTCPRRARVTANVATPTPNSMQYTSCVLLSEGPSPAVSVPAGLDLQQLAQVALELAGMTQAQAGQFLKNVNWRSTLGIPIPRYMRSYETVKVNGVHGTLLNMAGRRGPTYALLWAKNGTVYSLVGYGNPGDAVSMANSLD